MSASIYLDNNATTPVDPDVVQAMLPYFGTQFGNPSSKRHAYGWTADEAVAIAREQVASLVGARPDWVHFTAGATEAINWAIKAWCFGNEGKGKHIITVATEHPAVLRSCEWLERLGWSVTTLATDHRGLVAAEQVEEALTPETVLVCAMWANNEIGTVHPVARIADVVQPHQAALLVDATQALGKIPVTMGSVDFLACSAHKLYGPKGVGALLINGDKPRLRLEPWMHGGGQEFGRRAGTLNVPGIVGLGAAAEKAEGLLDQEGPHLARLRDGLEAKLKESTVVVINGEGAERLPNTSSVTFPGVDTAKLIGAVPELAVSTGSACSTGAGKPSHVLQAIGSDLESATLRLSLGRFTSEEAALRAAALLSEAVSQLQPVPLD
ncbi:MAG: cysteine desulfurase [Rhodothermales bacterium]|nr:cysteine desulfurase [Rhodothermales bacterium]MBO6778979.1 cysteine desulfurase [Rhodothermales bacterium]